MHTLLVLAVLAQIASTPPAAAIEPERTPFTFNDGERIHKLWESPVLVAEPAPTAARSEALRALGAVLIVDRPTMRVWKVSDASVVRTKVPDLRPVFHDNRSGVGRLRVPLALVCDGQRTVKPWLEVLEGSGGACLPDFWYQPVLK